MNTKQQTRNYITQLFQKQKRDTLDLKDREILTQLQIYIQENNIKNICIYESMSNEVDTNTLLNLLKEEKINIFTPQVISETEMIIIDKQYEPYEKEIDLFIVPGRAFTKEGKRLGRGKGYFDRFLGQKLYQKSKKIGICYDFQILTEIKTEKHDINMNLIITNTSC